MEKLKTFDTEAI